jgi:hypothetical protein
MLSLCIPDLLVSKLIRNAAGFFALGVLRPMPVAATGVSSGSFAIPGQQSYPRRRCLAVGTTCLAGQFSEAVFTGLLYARPILSTIPDPA